MLQDQFRALLIHVIQHQHARQIHTFVIVVYVVALLINVVQQPIVTRAQHQVQIRT
jgi:hypothetical protein